jgi:ubiquinone/menaquinone biosynthesis C-methylase UbiE
VSGRLDWNPQRAAAFFDEYGESEWTRFDEGRTPAPSLEVHLDRLRRFVNAGDRVLDVGAGPGRFTIELTRLGAQVTVADLSPGQLELNREHVEAEGLEDRVTERVQADVLDLSRWDDGSFDAAVCFGGPLSYVVDRAGEGIAELVRVTRPGGHVLVSVMSLAGTVVHFLPILVDLARRDGVAKNEAIVRTGLLPDETDYGHLAMKLFRWPELEALLSPHGTIVDACAAGLLPSVRPEEPELRAFLSRTELALADDPGTIGCGQHILAVLRRDA